MSAAPITYVWFNGAMHPLRRFRDEAAKRFVANERYMLDEAKGRSKLSHDHEFAWLADAWDSLPERLADQYPTPDHLRKRALVEAGYYDERIVDCGSNAAALRVAAFMKAKDEFAVVVVRGPIAVERTPQSQSVRAMGREAFQASKTAIIAVVSDLIGAPLSDGPLEGPRRALPSARAEPKNNVSTSSQRTGAAKNRVGEAA